MSKEIGLLVREALKSPAMKSAGYLRKLLNYLYEHRSITVTADDIWEEVLGETDAETDGQRVRELVSRLRKVLEEVALISDSPEFLEVPDASELDDQERRGYRVKLSKRPPNRSTAVFWRPHTVSENVQLVYTEPVFYYDIFDLGFVRYLDTNPKSVDTETATTELQEKHQGPLMAMHPNTPIKEWLRPSRVYIGIGEMQAMDMLSGWFLKRSLLVLGRQASDRAVNLQKGCPILLDSERTNHYMQNYLESEEGKVFSFRQKGARVGFIHVRNASEKDLAKLNGFVIERAGEDAYVGQLPTLSQVRDRLVTVTRMPVPGGRGTTTMVSSDSTLALREVVAALTDDGEMDGLFAACGITEADFPKAFEMLLSVRIAPSNIEYEASAPILRLYRCY